MKVYRVDDDHNFEEQAVADGKFTMKGRKREPSPGRNTTRARAG